MIVFSIKGRKICNIKSFGYYESFWIGMYFIWHMLDSCIFTVISVKGVKLMLHVMTPWFQSNPKRGVEGVTIFSFEKVWAYHTKHGKGLGFDVTRRSSKISPNKKIKIFNLTLPCVRQMQLYAFMKDFTCLILCLNMHIFSSQKKKRFITSYKNLDNELTKT